MKVINNFVLKNISFDNFSEAEKIVITKINT
jgi:hypothetical protein